MASKKSARPVWCLGEAQSEPRMGGFKKYMNGSEMYDYKTEWKNHLQTRKLSPLSSTRFDCHRVHCRFPALSNLPLKARFRLAEAATGSTLTFNASLPRISVILNGLKTIEKPGHGKDESNLYSSGARGLIQ